MKLQNLVRYLFQGSLLAITMTLGITPAVHALTFSLSWTGTGSTTLTGTFTGTDSQTVDTFIRYNPGGDTEVTAFDVTFRDAGNTVLATYNLSQLVLFAPDFNFNYDLTSGLVLQTGGAQTTSGFSIGSDTDYLFDTSGSSGGRVFTDFVGFGTNSDSGGTLTATPVPFEFEGTAGMIVVSSMFGLRHWYKKRKISGK